MSLHVLIVEDDDGCRETFAGILLDEGFEVVTSSGVGDAIEKLKAGLRPDVVLLDLMMPFLDGEDFRRVQRRSAAWSQIPVVLVSASPEVFARARELEIRFALQKPMSFESLLAVVREASGVPGAELFLSESEKGRRRTSR